MTVKKDRNRQKRTRRLCVSTFLLTLVILLTGLSLLMVDQLTGQVLFGDKHTLPTVDITVPIDWFPARLRVLWSILRGTWLEALP